MTARLAKGAARQKIVVDATAAAIAELGLANVRVADIAERAGMTAGHVTYYFPSKTDLLMLAIRRSEESLVEKVDAELRIIDQPWARLERLLELSASDGRGDPGWILWFQVWSDAATDDAVAAVHGELDGRWRSILREILAYGRERGAFTFDDLDDATDVISAAVDGLSVQLTVGAPGFDRERMLRLSLQVCSAFLGMRADVR
ncbi:TetR/AcrR family transcriptional regulator [Microbacterium sp. NPDC091662]|uniref:TetR/AcrR family transcriptional regulator n=1 Tax=Microbacterium sp. NPDC091662 TaxID=3364211 RepID=UPI0037F698E7